MLLVSTAYWSKAQVPDNPVTSDFSSTGAAGALNVENTGNEVAFVSGFGDVHVMCWDGSNPRWSWSRDNTYIDRFDIDGVNLGTVYDPDIVIEPVAGRYALIVYRLNVGGVENIHYEVWERTGLVFTNLLPSTALTTNGSCTYPNVDVNEQGDVAFVWQDNSTGAQTIFTRLSDIQGNLIGTSNVQVNIEYYNPDVAISNRQSSTSDVVVSFTYVKLGGDELHLSQHLYTDIASGIGTSLSNNAYDINSFGWSTPGIAGDFRFPRIAAINTYGSSGTGVIWNQQCAVAVDYWCTNGLIPPYLIHSVTQYGNPLLTTFELLNKPAPSGLSNLYDYISEKPVLTYDIRYVTVAWQSEMPVVSNPPFTDNFDIWVARLTNPNGTLSGLNVYSLVNILFNGIQILPSISGRHSSGAFASQNVYFTFFDQNLSPTDVKFKGSLYSSTQYRTAPDDQLSNGTDNLGVFPNPAFDQVRINLNSEKGSIRITNTLGQELVKSREVKNSDYVDVSTLPPGQYLVIITTDQGMERMPFTIIK
jgi:hypothetical protein